MKFSQSDVDMLYLVVLKAYMQNSDYPEMNNSHNTLIRCALEKLVSKVKTIQSNFIWAKTKKPKAITLKGIECVAIYSFYSRKSMTGNPAEVFLINFLATIKTIYQLND